MAFTRFYDDPDRVMKKIQESTDQGLYRLNQPGNGNKPYYIQDPSIILQKWGANVYHNRVQVESELMGITQPWMRDCEPRKKIQSDEIIYPVFSKEVTTQSRTILPVWMTRDTEQAHQAYLPFNPQETVFLPFSTVSTRLVERDASR